MTQVVIRPMSTVDVPGAEALSNEGFFELDSRMTPRSGPAPSRRSPLSSQQWVERTTHLIEEDGAGCWVAEQGDELLGFATSLVREKMWILATYAVRPRLQGHGIGRQLLEAAMQHGSGCLRAMIAASSDPKAARRYRLAGFTLHPQMYLHGPVPRETLPVLDRVREGTTSDIDRLNSIDRAARGAGHGRDHQVLTRHHRLLVCERSNAAGYAYLSDDGSPALLAATNRRTASTLLWEALASTTPETPVQIGHLTAANEWALDVGMQARMELHQRGYLALRHMKPPTCYLHHGALL